MDKKPEWTPAVAIVSEIPMPVMCDQVPSQGPQGLWMGRGRGETDPSYLYTRPILEYAMNQRDFHRVPQANPHPHP